MLHDARIPDAAARAIPATVPAGSSPTVATIPAIGRDNEPSERLPNTVPVILAGNAHPQAGGLDSFLHLLGDAEGHELRAAAVVLNR